MSILASEQYCPRPSGIVSLLMLTVTCIEAVSLHIHIHMVGSTQNPGHSPIAVKIETIAPRAGTESTSVASQASVLTITPPMLPEVTTPPMLTCLCDCLPKRSVQTSIEAYLTEEITRIKCTKKYRENREVIIAALYFHQRVSVISVRDVSKQD